LAGGNVTATEVLRQSVRLDVLESAAYVALDSQAGDLRFVGPASFA
jgi:hypothetical protein